MSAEPDFDVIVVGAGVAGCITAYQLAGRGLSVALIDRGETPGSKNLSGGVLYTHPLQQVFPDFLQTAPIERRISRNQICFLNQDSSVAIDYRDARLDRDGTAVSVLRGRLDPWLAERCEDAGVLVMPGVRVDSLLIEDGRIVGVVAGEDELRARVTVAADGVNSFLARDAGLRPAPQPHQLAVGVKAVVQLPSDIIEARFGVDTHEGAAIAVVGDCTRGVGGGGFIYTNQGSISVGVVLRLDDLTAKGLRSTEVFDGFLDHPYTERLLRGGELLEYGCHLVAEGGQAMVGELVHHGLVIVGDAAGMTINTGLTVRGMDLAAGAAIAAAVGVAEAIETGDVTAAGLAGYPKALAAGFVGQDLQTYARAPKFLENPRMYESYGPLLADALHQVFGLDGSARKPLRRVAMDALKGSGIGVGTIVKDAWQGARAL